MTFNFQIWRNAQYNFKKEYDRGISSAKVFPIIPQSLKSRKHTKKSCWVAASELEIPCSPYIILWIWPHHCEGKNGFSLVCFWWYSYLRDLLKKMAKPTQLQRDFQVYMFFLFHLISVQKVWWNIMKIRLFAWPVKTRTSIGREQNYDILRSVLIFICLQNNRNRK